VSQAYWINRANGNYYLHFKINQPAGSQVTWTITKDNAFSPESPENFWDFWEDFTGSSLDSGKWDAGDYSASYSVSDSNFNTWNDAGGCCDSHCYYSAVKTTSAFNLPLRVLMAANQDPYESSTNCGRTGPFILYGNAVQVVTSTDTDSDSCSWAIGSQYGTVTNSTPMPDVAPDYFQFIVNIGTDRIEIDHNWWGEKFVKVETPPETINQWIGIGGDTDSSSAVDHIGYIAITTNSRNVMPEVTIIEQTEDYIKVTVDDSSTGNTVDFNDFIVSVKLPDGWIAEESQGLNIVNKTVYLLVEKPEDGLVYTWDGSAWQSLNKTKQELTSDDFVNSGVVVPLQISKTDLSNLSQTPNFLYHTPEGTGSVDCVVKFLPYSRLITQKVVFNLKDYTAISQIYGESTYTHWSGTGYAYTAVVSRDNKSWYVWDTTNNTWKFLEERELDYTNQADIDWVKNNGTGLGIYSSLTQTDWYHFFGDDYPDYIYFAIVFSYYDMDDDVKLDALYAKVDTKKFWQDVSSDHEIRFTENNLSIKFSSGGTYKINYLD